MTDAETIAGLRRLLARVYEAALKKHGGEGGSLNKVLFDVHWEGIGVPMMEAELAAHAEEVKR